MLLAALSVMAVPASVEARTINVRGRVTQQGSGEPLSGVTIYNASSDKLLGITNDEGRYTVSADDADSLIFSSIICEDHQEPINGRLSVDVVMVPAAQELQEIVVKAKGSGKALVTEPADLDVEGNFIRLKTKVKIPPRLFNSQVRMIIQPAIYNVTRKHVNFITPVVFDGWRYADTQKRMLDWDMTEDPLAKYQQVKTTGRRADNIIYLIDSLYVDNPNDDFMCVVMSSLEDYNRIIYADTFEIARGTVNPLRFLNYQLAGAPMNEERFLPMPEMELCDAAGEMNLLFAVGKSDFDPSLGNNAAEMQSLINEFHIIGNDPDMTLKSFTIYGSASPEGSYDGNLRLAGARMKSAMRMIMDSVDPSLRRNAEMNSEAEVASWDEVVTLLRADGRDDEADKVQNVIDSYAGVDARSQRMTRLPFYRSLIVQDYLPKLRRVRYHIISSRYRPLTLPEIASLYAADKSGLSRYQYWRLYTAADSMGLDREQVITNALNAHPKFAVAATEVANIMLERGENPMSILEPFFADESKIHSLPMAMRYDMAVACMDSARFSRADSLLADLPDNPEFHKAKIYCAALNGRYHEVMQEISEDSPLNEVLLLLAVKDNEHAYNRAQKLGGSAIEEYVKAVAANRLDDYITAISHLENALALDPSLIEVARVDGDVVDLLDEEDLNSDEDDEK